MFDDRDDDLKPVASQGETPACAHPAAIPRKESIFQPVRDRYGWRLALVFGNHAAGGLCPYYTGERCFHCDIGAGEGTGFDLGANRERLAWFQAYYQDSLASINHLVLYNSGSVLNPRELPPEMLEEIIAFASSLPAVAVISLDSREAFIRPTALVRLLRAAPGAVTIRPILGIESADDRIRNSVLRKDMSRTAIERVYKELGQLAVKVGRNRIGLDVNIVIAAPGTDPVRAVDDAVLTASFALAAGAAHGVPVDLNLHPYYPGARGVARFPGHPRCSLATTVKAVRRISEIVRSMNADTTLFIGWNDEGHDTERRQRDREWEQVGRAFDTFNHTNNACALDAIHSLAR